MNERTNEQTFWEHMPQTTPVSTFFLLFQILELFGGSERTFAVVVGGTVLYCIVLHVESGRPRSSVLLYRPGRYLVCGKKEQSSKQTNKKKSVQQWSTQLL